MNQIKNGLVNQVLYLGRWVNKDHFRTFVYGTNKEQKLAKSYEEYTNLLETGDWFASMDEAKPKGRKPKNGAIS